MAPGPSLTPTDVVLAQLAALREEPLDGVGAGPGLRAVWELASEDNRAATGPVERFAEMLRGSVYRSLLSHRAAQLGPVLEQEGEAQLEVLVLSAADEAVGFTWVLSQQPDGCWRTDGVLRHPDRADR
ncbi:MAG: DUF4864 domain-containing protein [Mycobacteriales bacterium]